MSTNILENILDFLCSHKEVFHYHANNCQGIDKSCASQSIRSFAIFWLFWAQLFF